jgi:signal transduction histidine kinase
MSGLALAGWVVAVTALAAAVVLARRLELAVRAEHELRGPLTALTLGVEALRREPAARERADALGLELDRARLALADLHAARRGRRAAARRGPVALDRLLRSVAAGWDPVALEVESAPVVHSDRARLSQAVSNLLANAVEHGAGTVELKAGPGPRGVRLEVRDEGPGPDPRRRPRRGNGRGRGLAIARAAAEDAGGRLTIVPGEGGATVAIDLPAGEPDAAA